MTVTIAFDNGKGRGFQSVGFNEPNAVGKALAGWLGTFGFNSPQRLTWIEEGVRVEVDIEGAFDGNLFAALRHASRQIEDLLTETVEG